MTDLLPCPFCGGDAELMVDEFGDTSCGTVMCMSCYATSPDKSDWQDAVVAWNARALSREVICNPCALNAREGEPVFVLLGRDPDAIAAVETWIDTRMKRRGWSNKLQNAKQVLAKFIQHQEGECE